jgi:hypothetical protein
MFSLYARLAAVAVVAVFLAGTHYKAYKTGQDAITADWQADIAARTAAALEASEQARKTEQELSAKVKRIDRAYQNQKRATASAVAAAAVGVRDFETILSAPATADSDACPASGNHGTGGIERELLGQCAAALAGMGAEADRLSIKVVTLQEYIRALK